MMEEEGDNDRGKVSSLIEMATNSTASEVNPRLLKAIKTLVRSSDSEVELSVETLMEKMKINHSQVRYLALLITDELFMRSKLFRSLLVVKFDQFLSLSIGFRRNLPLPAPPAVASRLRSKAIEFLEKWNTSFGIHYRQLRLGFDYLKNTLQFQFPNLLQNAARIQIQQERLEREIRSKEILLNKFESLRENLSSIKDEIQLTVHEIGQCLDILHTKDDDFIPYYAEEEEIEEFRCSSLQQIRLVSLKEGEKVQESSDNKIVLDALRELYKLLVTRHLVSVQEWISVLVRVEPSDTRFRDSTLKEFIDLRNHLQTVKKSCQKAGCTLTIPADNEEEDLWEEGKIEAFVEGSSSTYNNKPDEDLPDPSTFIKEKNVDPAVSQDVSERSDGGDDSNSNFARKKLLAEAPVMNWGSFLDRWGSKQDVLANQRGLELEGHWGRVDQDAVIPAEKIAELNVQATLYKEEHVETKPCLAPLKKGGLCQRRDLNVCLFHGPIIARDAEGNPIDHVVPLKKGGLCQRRDLKVCPLKKGGLCQRRDLKVCPFHGPIIARDAEGNPIDHVVPKDEESLNLGTETVQKLAEQAVKNVRGRDREEMKKIENDRKVMKRAKLAKVREHNDTVLRQAAIASTSYSEFAGEEDLERGGRSGSYVREKKQTLASMLRKKVKPKDRLAQRLLSARARDSTRQLTMGEDTKYREAFPNQW